MHICKGCAFFLNLEPDSVRANVWYNHLCKASPRKEVINPQTGKREYAGVNSLGITYGTDEPYNYCRDINPTGECNLYVPKSFS